MPVGGDGLHDDLLALADLRASGRSQALPVEFDGSLFMDRRRLRAGAGTMLATAVTSSETPPTVIFAPVYFTPFMVQLSNMNPSAGTASKVNSEPS